MLNVIKPFIQVILLEKSSLRFAFGIILGFAFSISVILATIGVMDGFGWSLKLGLKKSMGDLSLYYRDGLFNFEKDVEPFLKKVPKNKLSPVIKTEAFAVTENISKGVMVKGVDQEKFSRITGLNLAFNPGEVAIGKELARTLDLKEGDTLVIAFSKGNSQINELPSLESFTVGQIVEHGIYQKDLRFIYLDLKNLQSLLELENYVNSVVISALNENNIDYFDDPDKYINSIENTIDIVEEELGDDFYARPFWAEFSFLLRAVATEKYMIGIILQLVVIISIFNVLAFVIYANESRARELFLFQALGMSQTRVLRNMMLLIIIAWLLSCILSLGFVSFFDFALANFSVFQIPGDIYTLGSLSINLDLMDYVTVFVIAFFWVFLVTYFGLARIRKQSILQGLRREFA